MIPSLIKGLQKYDKKAGPLGEEKEELREITDKLIAIGEPAVLPLLEILPKMNNHSFSYTTLALGEIGDERAIGPLLHYIEDRYLGVECKEALIKFGPVSLDRVIEKIDYRIKNPIKGAGIFFPTKYSLSVVGEIRSDKSVAYLNQLLKSYMELMPWEPFEPSELDWPYRNVDFFHLLDCMVKQQDERCIPCLEETRDMFPRGNTEFLVCHIAIGRIKKGHLKGCLPLEALDLYFPSDQLMDVFLGNPRSRKDSFLQEYGEYFEDMEDLWNTKDVSVDDDEGDYFTGDESEVDEERERRIHEEIIVDCYDEEEQLGGWYHYLQDSLDFPFQGICIKERIISPLMKGDEVKVIEMAPYDECSKEMFVIIEWEKNKNLAIPLVQINSLAEDSITQQAISDWHYWIL